MLCPNVNDVLDDLAAVETTLSRISSFVFSIRSATVGSLSPLPSWLADVQALLRRSREFAKDWDTALPRIKTPICSGFIRYADTFSALSSTVAESETDAESWTTLLQAPRGDLESNAGAMRDVQSRMSDVDAALKLVDVDLDQTKQEVEAAHEGQHEELTKIAGKIGELMGRLGDLTDEINSRNIESGEPVFDTVSEVVLPIIKGVAEEVPFVTIAISVLTVGKSMYDLIQFDKEIREKLHELYELMNEQSEETQALGASHAVLWLIESLRKEYTAAAAPIPRLNTYWKTEADKIATVLDALRTGSDPERMIELATLRTARATWDRLSKAAKAVAMRQVKRDERVVTLRPRPSGAVAARIGLKP